MSDLIEQLRRLARYDHDDLSIGADAADRIEQLERELATAVERAAKAEADLTYFKAYHDGMMKAADETIMFCKQQAEQAEQRIAQLADAVFTQNAAREKAEASCAAIVDRKLRVPDDEKMKHIIADAVIHNYCLDTAAYVVYCINAELERRGL